MALTSIETLRLKTGDKSSLKREQFIGAGGGLKAYSLDRKPVLESPAPQVWLNDTLQTLTTHYTIDHEHGFLTFVTAPSAGDKIEVQYYWSIFTDEELEGFLTESSDDVTIASARVLLAIAADKAKVAVRETLQGGGGMGAITHDTSVAAKELRETAKALIQQKVELYALEGLEPADQLTEIPWTVFELEELDIQALTREGYL